MKTTSRKVAIGIAATTAALSLIFGVHEVTEGPAGQRERGPIGERALRPNITEVPATFTLRYFVVPIKHRGWGTRYRLDTATHHVRNKMKPHRGAGFRIWVKNHPHEGTNRRTLKGAVHRWRYLVQRVGQRHVVYIKSQKDAYRLRSTKWDINPLKYAATEGTTAIDIIVGTMLARHRGLQLWGIFECRTTVYGGWSQHAWSNAVDFGGTTSILDATARDGYNLTKQGWLPASQIIWKGREMFSGHSIYDHYNHAHFSGRPLRSGTPPCA